VPGDGFLQKPKHAASNKRIYASL